MIINEKSLFNELIKKYGFYIEEINIDNAQMWIAIKDVEDGKYSVMVTDEDNYDATRKYGEDYLRYKGVKYSLNIVVLSNNNSIISYDNTIVYDKKNDVIVYSSQSCEPIRKIISSMIERKRVNKSNKKKGITITNVIIAINVIVFLISAILSRSIGDINTYVLVMMGAKVDVLISQGQVYRLITCMFLHGGIMHLLFNMYALYCLGDLIEDVYGKVNYIIIYMVSGLCSSILSYMISPSISVGASGAIFGMFGAALIFALKKKNEIGTQFLNNMIMVIGLNIVIGLTNSGIDNAAHFGGLIGGVILSFILLNRKKIS